MEPEAEGAPRYPFVAVDVRCGEAGEAGQGGEGAEGADAGEADEVAAALFELGASGVEERDEQTLARGAGAGRVTLVGSFADRAAADEAIAGLREAFPHLAPRLEEVVGDAWRDAWKAHFAPFALTPRITVVPPWIERQVEREGELLLHLEPGRAFGTGLHASTALVAQLLDARADRLAGAELLDVGTGSGILALVALLLGAARAVAIDSDADVIEVVRENAERNALASRVEARAGTADGVTGRFPWVLANIEARVLRPLAPELERLVAPGGTLILSGVLQRERDAMVALYTGAPHALLHEETRSSDAESPDGWVAIALRAPP